MNMRHDCILAVKIKGLYQSGFLGARLARSWEHKSRVKKESKINLKSGKGGPVILALFEMTLCHYKRKLNNEK